MPASRFFCLISSFFVLSLVDPCAQADSVSDFYRGKTITIQVGYGPGGGYDLTARLISQFYGSHIPGKPNIIVQNVPGAGSMKLANSIYNNTANDGLTLGVFAFDVALEPYYGEKRAMFDPAKLDWIGSMDTDTQFCAVWKGAGVGIKTLPDLLTSKKVLTFGSSAPGAVPSVYPLFFKNALGASLRVVNGYTGTKDIILAMQRGEMDASCGLFESLLQASYMDLIQAGDLDIFVQTSLDKRSTVFPEATPILDVIKTDDQRQLAQLVFGPAGITRPLVAPPGTHPDRLSALRKALFATIADPVTKEVASKMKMDLRPKSVEEITSVLEVFQQASPISLSKAYAVTHE